jgi:hypothetical protein
MKEKIIFTSFAAGSKLYRASASRIEMQARNSNFFDSVYVYTDLNAPNELKKFFIENKELFKKKGYGYWIWKPFLINEILKKSKDGDIICYADSGCEISKFGKELFLENIKFTSSNGSLFFHMPGYHEMNWTKKSVLDFFGATKDKSIILTPQIQATYFYIKNNQVNRKLIRDWLIYCNFKRYYLGDDSDNFGINAKTFIDHRHDQSILSLLVKRNKIVTKEFECFHHRMFYFLNSNILRYPIHSFRNRNGRPRHPLVFKYSSKNIVNSNSLLLSLFKALSFLINFIYLSLKHFLRKVSC